MLALLVRERCAMPWDVMLDEQVADTASRDAVFRR